MRARSRAAPALLACIAGLAGCGDSIGPVLHAVGPDGAVSADASGPDAGAARWQPHPGTSWQVQLTGDVDLSLDVAMYEVDLDAPASDIAALRAAGRAVVCYFSAGTLETWRADAALFPAEVIGIAHPRYPDERYLDIRATAVRDLLAARIALALSRGCVGVAPSTMDSFEVETGFPLTASDQLAFDRWLADEAHRQGLAIGLYDDLAQAAELAPVFDWARSSDCFETDECDPLRAFITLGKPVFHVEYDLAPEVFCDRANALDFDALSKRPSLDAYRIACR